MKNYGPRTEMMEYDIEANHLGTFWYKLGTNQMHRTDGPAIERADGSKWWYQNDKLHRTDGPAIEYANGTKSWWLDGKRHREGGPAIEFADGTKEWYLNGKELAEEEFNRRISRSK